MKLRGIWGSIIGGGGLGGFFLRTTKILKTTISGVVHIVITVISSTALRGIVRIEVISETFLKGRVKICIKTPDMSPQQWKSSGKPKESQWDASNDAMPQEWKTPQVCVFK